jgi:uncharacterized membrane protein YhaH (DUF805 family)
MAAVTAAAAVVSTLLLMSAFQLGWEFQSDLSAWILVAQLVVAPLTALACAAAIGIPRLRDASWPTRRLRLPILTLATLFAALLYLLDYAAIVIRVMRDFHLPPDVD